ncbi:MAG: hypothetical protein KY450_08380 [Actinobacteria bacterium]|nr:hypothetical protein [Actinomycetota bacterium]
MRNGDVTSAGPDRGQGRPGPRRGLSEAVVATGLGVLFALAAGLQLFWGQDVGLADNGDGFRLMCHFGLLKTVDVIANPLVLQYAPVPYGCAPELAYLSSQEWLVRPALWAYRLRYGADAGFDLRVLGLVHSALFGLLLAAFYLALPGRRRARVLTTVLAGVLLADITFVTYFVSPFSEPATFLGLLAVVAAATWYVRARGALWVPLVVLVGATVFVVLAKSQTFVFAVLVAPVLLSRTVDVGALSGRWRGRVIPAAACVVLLATAGGNLAQQPPFFAEVNNHNLVFRTLLVDAPDPAAVLRSLGVPEDLVRYRGTGYFDAAAAGKAEDSQYQEFQRVVGRRELITYLATHPRHWFPLLRAGIQAVAELRTPYLSNYPAPSGDQLLAPRPNPSERLLGAFGGAGWLVLLVVWVAAIISGAVVLYRRSSATDAKALGAACYLLGATASSQVVIAVVGDGYYELVKHTVLAGYATALLLAVAAGALVSVRRTAREQPTRERPDSRPAVHPAPAPATSGIDPPYPTQ